MSSYKISFDKIRQSPELAEMIEALERGFDRFSIDFYLIGAVARDVWMEGIHGTQPKRATRDIDFAVLINKEGTFEALREYLIDEEGFHPSKENTFVLIWKNRLEVDLMPFGRIEQDGKIEVQGTGLTTQHVTGFNEVYEAGLPEVELEDKHKFKFCTIQGIVLLKLIAWNDRPESRRSDIEDISDILLNYFDMFTDHIYEYHSDLFGDEEEDLTNIAAQVLGREIGHIAKRKEAVLALLQQILQKNTLSAETSHIAAIMAGTLNNTVEDNLTLLRRMMQGIEEITAQ